MTEPLKQVAALPLVETEEGTLVLLVTTRGRGRWTIPKGWPKQGMADPVLAAKEAADEAGVEGDIGPEPVGVFGYTKRLHLFSWAKCRVAVYPLRVRLHNLEWPEKQARMLRWASPDEAATLVADTELAALLRDVFHSEPA